jgi:maltose O-acetyltransferase
LIGANCHIGANVEILDSDFHGLRIEERSISKPEWAAPVVIEERVFVGSNVRILKGVRIGMGAVIANSSLVTSDIPPMGVAAGIPAKIIRMLD